MHDGPSVYLQEGDCVVVFRKRDIYQQKKMIEATTDYNACVVYGALPAETRQEQARLFNTPGTGYNVLVATDAVGMGLNLNIRRVVFSTLNKPTRSQEIVPLSASAIKQLAGRAGRRNRYGAQRIL